MVLAIALWGRVFRLGQPDLWGDETLFLKLCDPQLSVAKVISNHLSSFSTTGHLPVVAVINNIAFNLLGIHSTSQITAGIGRTPGVIMGFLSIIVMALWIRRQAVRKVPLILPIAVIAFCFGHWWYSREAYYYPGLMLLSAVVLLAVSHLLDAVPAEAADGGAARDGRSIFWAAVFLVGVAALIFSHGSVMSLAVPLGVYALVRGLRQRRQSWPPYLIFGAVVVCCAGVLMAAGTGQQKAPWIDAYRFPPWVSAVDVLEFYGLGPGWLRLVISAGLVAVGALAVWRARRPAARGVLVLLPVIFLLVHFGSRNQMYQLRYFLPVLPFLLWLFTEALAWGVSRLPAARRSLALACVVVALGANMLPGFVMAADMHAKRDALASFARAMDAHLAPGTLCIWEGGHCMNFIPRFHVPKTPFTYTWLDAMPVDYLEGRVLQKLKAARRAFPFVAYLEWGAMNSYYSALLSGPSRPPSHFDREFSDLFGGNRVAVGDPVLEQLMRTRWAPTAAVPRLADDEPARLQGAIWQSVMHMYYTRPAGIRSFQPLPGEWVFTFAGNGVPLLLAGTQARIQVGVTQSATVKVVVVGLVPGTLTFSSGGEHVSVPFAKAGETRELSVRQNAAASDTLWNWRYEPVADAATAIRAGQPAFALLETQFTPVGVATNLAP